MSRNIVSCIKSFIVSYENKYFEKKELNNIISSAEKNLDYSTELLQEIILKYIYFDNNKTKYYINSKRINKKIITDVFTKNKNKNSKKETKDYDSDNSTDSEFTYELEYKFPKKEEYNKKIKFPPYGTQNVNEEQQDDKWSKELELRSKKFDMLRAIKLPEQRTKEWFEMREGKITASDGGVVLGMNKYEPQYKFILKKTIGAPFNSNRFCYHGKKLEEPATMVYAYRMNVRVDEFGLMGHQSIPFLGASPDGICNQYKYDKTHKSKFVGRMLEIKCPLSRNEWRQDNIPLTDLKNLSNKNVICPAYYWIQVQLQLECCDLEECDFWQCKIGEYNNREDFIFDTHGKEPFRSYKTKQEKGCLLQLLPYDSYERIKNQTSTYDEEVYDKAIFIYPTEIEMTPDDCDQWIKNTLEKYWLDKDYERKEKPLKYRNYKFDKVIYWRIEDSKNNTILRDKEWFSKNYPTFEKIWNQVLFLRKNRDHLDIFVRYLRSLNIKKNKVIMETIDKLCDLDSENYELWYENLLQSIKDYEIKNKIVYKHIDEGKKEEKILIDFNNNISETIETFKNDPDLIDVVIKEIYNKKYTNIEDDIKKFNNKKYQKQKKYEILGIDERDKTEFNKEFDIFKFEDSYDQTDSDSYGFD